MTEAPGVYALKIKVQGYRRIGRAEIAVEPRIALVGAGNGEGKTSLAQAVQACLTAEPIVIDDVTKAEAQSLVTRGHEKGFARVEGDTGSSVTITWPKLEILQDHKNATGQAVGSPHSSPIAAGVVVPMRMKAADRLKVLSPYLLTTVSRDDIMREVQALGFPEKFAESVYTKITLHGWDTVEQGFADHGKTLKGQWKEATGGQTWGSVKGHGWRPQGWTTEMDSADLSSIERELGEARVDYDRAVATAAVATADKSRLRTEAEYPAGMSRADLKTLETQMELNREELAGREAALAKIPPERTNAVPCPKCGAHLVWKDIGPGQRSVEIAPEQQDHKVVDANRTLRAQLSGQVSKMKTDAVEDNRKIILMTETIARVEAAQAALAEAVRGDLAREIAEDADQGGLAAIGTALPQAVVSNAIAEKKAVVDTKTRELAMFSQAAVAGAIHAKLMRNDALLAWLSPAGIRQRKMVEGVEELNKEMAQICAWAGWEVVRLDEGMRAFYGIEPFKFCSESQQYRVDVTLQVAIAIRDNSDLIVVDRIDILEPQARDQMLKLMVKSKRRFLGLMTVRDAGSIPYLGAKLGHSYWIRAGEALELYTKGQGTPL